VMEHQDQPLAAARLGRGQPRAERPEDAPQDRSEREPGDG